MAPHSDTAPVERLTMPPWARNLPVILIVVGVIVGLIAAVVNVKQFAYSYLLAFMFFLSICLGALFLVLVHHLFDASWSVPIRRYVEHMACLAPVMAALFVPIAILAPRIYEWMHRLQTGEIDHSLQAKQPLFTIPMFYVVAV